MFPKWTGHKKWHCKFCVATWERPQAAAPAQNGHHAARAAEEKAPRGPDPAAGPPPSEGGRLGGHSREEAAALSDPGSPDRRTRTSLNASAPPFARPGAAVAPLGDDLDSQIVGRLALTAVSPDELALLVHQILARVTAAVQALGLRGGVEVFGSLATGFGSVGSDLDMAYSGSVEADESVTLLEYFASLLPEYDFTDIISGSRKGCVCPRVCVCVCEREGEREREREREFDRFLHRTAQSRCPPAAGSH
ncbi:unnamed protein product [Prorocentrum cordatum]|uniref:Polymerase nucleotidyl transferase domain-containing protein n=1 Tax=Prorocentrum cordatum TaxID=2364126 RepID=A0ABN9TUS1_9DINO|nr:unnamed protein product [Polarella glacialis]